MQRLLGLGAVKATCTWSSGSVGAGLGPVLAASAQFKGLPTPCCTQRRWAGITVGGQKARASDFKTGNYVYLKDGTFAELREAITKKAGKGRAGMTTTWSYIKYPSHETGRSASLPTEWYHSAAAEKLPCRIRQVCDDQSVLVEVELSPDTHGNPRYCLAAVPPVMIEVYKGFMVEGMKLGLYVDTTEQDWDTKKLKVLRCNLPTQWQFTVANPGSRAVRVESGGMVHFPQGTPRSPGKGDKILARIARDGSAVLVAIIEEARVVK